MQQWRVRSPRSKPMVSLGSLKISFLFVATVLIFFTAGLLSLAPRARRLLGAYRIPRRPAFSSHLINALIGQVLFDLRYEFAPACRTASSTTSYLPFAVHLVHCLRLR